MKILIANRGEIAVRIIRACREMDFPTVAVYSDCDRTARHVREADQAVHIGPDEAAKSYLRIEAIVDAAQRTGADAVHPGYGFLAENARFAQACQDAGLTFIGPSPDVIAMMGSKTAARGAAIRAGVPVVPGTEQPFDIRTPDEVVAEGCRAIGYPVVVKAVAGGGGKGMRVVEQAGDLAAIRDRAVGGGRGLRRHQHLPRAPDHPSPPYRDPAARRSPRHRSCRSSSASARSSAAIRRWSRSRRRWRSIRRCGARMAAAAAAVARSVGYTSAGTIEFLLDADGSFYFLEMNTRLQVEHPVTEMVTGLDLVQWQIRIARGEALDIDPERALDAARPRHRMPHLRRGSGPGLHAVARPDSRACVRPLARASETMAG